MKKLIHLKDNSPLLRYTSSITDICRPLFDSTDISFLYYGRLYEDGSAVVLSTYASWVRYTIEHGIYSNYQKLGALKQQKASKGDRFQITGEDIGFINRAAKGFNVSCITSEVKILGDYKEIWTLGSLDGCDFRSALPSYRKFIERFKVCFRTKAASIIQQAEWSRVALPVCYSVATTSQPTETVDFQIPLPKRVPIHFNGFESYVTRSELKTLSQVAKGYSASQSGERVGVGGATVEEYIARVKSKFGLDNQQQLRELYYGTDLKKLLT